MAASRSFAPLFAPAKRVKFIPTRTYTQTFSRTKSSKAEADDEHDIDVGEAAEGVDIHAEINKGSMPLDERLEDMGIDPKEYRRLANSQKRAQAQFQRWEPKDKEQAERRWKELQDSPDHLTTLSMFKREGVEPIQLAKERGLTLPNDKAPLDPKTQEALDALRSPINVQAVHLRPLRRTPEHGVPVCDLQLRTYSIRNLLLFADFAVRAAYYMGLCARGPVPLPKITERWTVPRSNFIFKKSQENFERITLRRLIQIQDGHPDVVKAWLTFLQKHQYYGVGMKANIWEYESLEAATRAGYDIKHGDHSRRRQGPMLEKVDEILKSKGYREAMKGYENPTKLSPEM